MNKEKAISSLQSRIAKRKKQIAFEWWIHSKDNISWTLSEKKLAYIYAIQEGYNQKFDKALLKLLYEDVRKQQYYADVVYDLQEQNQYYRRALASYKLTGHPYEGG